MIENISSEKTKLEAFDLLKEGFGEKTEKLFKNFLLSKQNQSQKRLGVLFKYDGITVGVLLLFERDRIFEGKDYKFINFSSWYFKKQYRAFAPILIKKIIIESPQNSILTNFTPHSSAIKIFNKLGFNHFDVRFSPFTINIFKYSPAIKIKIINENIPKNIPKNIKEIFNNLSSKNIYNFALYNQLNSDECFFSLCFFQKKGLRFARILFTSNPEIFVQNLSKIKLNLIINYRCFGFLFPNFGAYRLINFSFKTNGKYLYKSSKKHDSIDLLFSEFTELLN
jgi:hypothetical protein